MESKVYEKHNSNLTEVFLEFIVKKKIITENQIDDIVFHDLAVFF